MFKNSKQFYNSFKSSFNKNTFKNFSSFNNNMNSSTKQSIMYGLLGVSTAGLGFLCFQNLSKGSTYTKALINTSQSQEKEIVNRRLRSTMVYFCSGLGLTAGLTAVMARSPKLAPIYTNPFVSFGMMIPTIFFIYKTRSTPSDSNMKPFYYFGFNTCMAFSLAPFALIIPMKVLRDAGILTSGLFAGLGLVSMTSRDDAFLGMSGFLGAGLGAMIALSFANIFLQSPIINSIWLYGGLILFSGFTIYDIKQLQIKAKKEISYDPMYNSIGIYLDFIQLFIRMAMIMNNRKNK